MISEWENINQTILTEIKAAQREAKIAEDNYKKAKVIEKALIEYQKIIMKENQNIRGQMSVKTTIWS